MEVGAAGRTDGGGDTDVQRRQCSPLLFEALLPHARHLCTDMFGNYLLQVLFEASDLMQRGKLLEIMAEDVAEAACQSVAAYTYQNVLRMSVEDVAMGRVVVARLERERKDATGERKASESKEQHQRSPSPSPSPQGGPQGGKKNRRRKGGKGKKAAKTGSDDGSADGKGEEEEGGGGPSVALSTTTSSSPPSASPTPRDDAVLGALRAGLACLEDGLKKVMASLALALPKMAQDTNYTQSIVLVQKSAALLPPRYVFQLKTGLYL